MDNLPGVSDVLRIAEVAHASINYNRGVKPDLYARYAIPEIWQLAWCWIEPGCNDERQTKSRQRAAE